jgi:hypothetical protein
MKIGIKINPVDCHSFTNLCRKRFRRTIAAILTVWSLMLSFTSQANDENYGDDLSGRLFYSYESNGADYISAIGTGMTFKNPDTNFGFQLNTSIGAAEVMATDGYVEEYLVWDGSIKVGYFSTISAYVEGGIDLTELLFHDLRYDQYDHDFGYEDNIDAYIGAGLGIRLQSLAIDAFVRARNIDSKYWQAESEVFSGIQVSINF